MISFSQYLIEMTIRDAMSVLDINTGFDSDALKTAFRRASSKNHPDKGGSTEAMQKVNQAYAMLKDSAGGMTRETQMQAHTEKMRDLAVIVRKDLMSNLDLKAYTKHFDALFGEEFAMLVTKVYPDDAEITRLTKLNYASGVHSVNVHVEWNNHDRTKVFQFNISVGIVNLMGSGGLAASDTTYQMGVQTFAYINGRKIKITARDYTSTAKKAVFTKPESVFPKAKLVNKKQSKFKKSDMLSALKAEIRADVSGDFHFIPLKGDQFLAISRTTMRRVGMWSMNGIWMKKGKYSMTRNKDIDFGFYSFMEDEDTLNMFRKVKNMDAGKVDKFINAEYTKRKS